MKSHSSFTWLLSLMLLLAAEEVALGIGSVDILHEASGLTPPSAILDTFYDDWLVNQVNTGGADVTISTANSLNGSAEDLTLQTGANVSWNSTNSLTLVGNNSLTLQSGSTIANLGTGNLTLQSGGGVALRGTVNMAAGLAIHAGTSVAFDGQTTVGGNLNVIASSVVVEAETLAGGGSITAPVIVQPGGTLSPGGNSVGVLSIAGSLTLSGTDMMDLAKTNDVLTSDLITNVTTLALGGTLQLNISGEALAAGDAFKLYSAHSINGTFISINPATPGAGLKWDASELGSKGVLKVAAASAADVVTTLADGGYGSLRQTIADASPGDTITFATNGTIALLTGELGITKNLTIAGPGPANLAIDAGGNSRVMEITNASVTLDMLTLTNGHTSGSGSGILLDSGAALMLDYCSLSGNSANYGGGIGDESGGLVVLNYCTLFGNTATNAGGGIDTYLGTNALKNCTVSGNTAKNGGGIECYSAALMVNNCSLSGNTASYGGGINNDEGGTVAIFSSTLSSNSAYGGGGIASGGTNDTLLVTNSTIAGNTALFAGGINQNGGMTLVQCTISGNVGTGGSGGVVLSGGIVNLENTIIAANPGSADPDVGGTGATLNLSGVNLIGQSGYYYLGDLPAGLPNTNGDYVGTAGSPLDPLLAPLGNYGGPTLTMPSLVGSLAIDNGDDSVTSFLTTDQRGYPRLSGAHVDIGAVEAQYAPGNNPPQLMNAASSGIGGNNSFHFTFTNVPNADFTVLASTNLALPLADWIEIGNAAQNSPGQYQFTDPGATNYPQRFYQVISP